MTDTKPLLFQDDLKKFMEIVMIGESEARFDALKANFDDVVLCEIVRYGVISDAAMIAPLAELYQSIVGNYPEDRRIELFRHIKGLVDNFEFVSVNALLPFIAEEPLAGIASTAVIDYVSVGRLANNDPMSRPGDIVGLIESGRLKNVGAAFGGLLHLGDRRVCKLIWPLRDQLEKEDVRIAINCTTGFLYSACVEFEIDWLEEMDGDVEDGLFGIVASGLARQIRQNQFEFVFTGERRFPMLRHPTPADQERTRELAMPIPVEEYTKRIAPRLYALERTEPPPRVMPLVLAAWDLTPITDQSEVARMDNRHRPSSTPRPGRAAPIAGDEIVEVQGEWFDGEGQIFLSWGILNPNGPTLYCLGEKMMDGERRLFFRWLHMLGGRTYYAKASEGERASYNEIFESASAISKYLSQQSLPTLFNTIPSFVIPNDGDDTIKDIARRMIAADAPDGKDWGREVAYIEAFGDDYFSRAGCEIRTVYEREIANPDITDASRDYLKWVQARYGSIPAFTDAVFPEFRSSSLTAELYDRWWKVVGTTKHSNSALGQLAMMWRGATSMLSDDMATDAVHFDRVIEFQTAFNFSLPE